MQLTHFLTTTFAASALAATFIGFSDTACQRYDGTYATVTGAQLQDIAVNKYPTTNTVLEASRYFTRPGERETCPSNSDDTYKWVSVPQWQEGSLWSGGGAIATVYYKETDTYRLCRHLANVQRDGYAGRCR
ncbi:hypothetical protein GQ44DRAFT_822678 [Phaeosphaeriaceae sp. PMI808]|nr:hypothetical protein GQ44DRAFT_822678 [Phaeosphaeriaceae sp. PMI808]